MTASHKGEQISDQCKPDRAFQTGNRSRSQAPNRIPGGLIGDSNFLAREGCYGRACFDGIQLVCDPALVAGQATRFIARISRLSLPIFIYKVISGLRRDAPIPKCDIASVMRGAWMEGIMGKPDSVKSPAPLSGKHKAPSGKTDSAKKTVQKEIGGPKGPEPTRYGDWERKGIVSDF